MKTDLRTICFHAISIAVVMWTLFGESACFAQSAKLSLTGGGAPPIIGDPGHPGFIDQLAREMFKRIDVEVEVTRVPSERSLINVNAGLDDGDLFRVAGLEKEYPNLVLVPEKMLDNDFVVFTKRKDIRIRTWDDLKPYAVAFVTGWKPYELNVKGTRDLTKTPSIHELLPLLENGRADLVLMDRWQGGWIAKQQGYTGRVLDPPLARFEEFMYLNKKHAALASKAANALAGMKADGSYQKLYDTYLKPFIIR
jgi:polar amino acid transport system substrate-binding protein